MSRWDGVDLGDITCRQFVDLVADYLEDRLNARTRDQFDRHLANCPGCARYLDQIRASARVLGRVSLDPLSSEAKDQLLDAFRAWRSSRAPG